VLRRRRRKKRRFYNIKINIQRRNPPPPEIGMTHCPFARKHIVDATANVANIIHITNNLNGVDAIA
jgi:hypothetical protein